MKKLSVFLICTCFILASVGQSYAAPLSQTDTASSDPNAVPSGGILIPMLGVGGHCLPKDGILLWWRSIENKSDTSSSLILNSRFINDESPAVTFKQAEKSFGSLKDKKLALLGVAYRFNSEDTRNSPTLTLANHLREQGISYIMHDPYVKKDDQNLLKFDQQGNITSDMDEALKDADYIIVCTAHKIYMDELARILSYPNVIGIMDACNIYNKGSIATSQKAYAGIGRGSNMPEPDLVQYRQCCFIFGRKTDFLRR